jgi:two-component system, LytTR family, response regulator
MKALIVDDEPIARQILREELELQNGIVVVGEAENGTGALEQIRTVQPDVVFLDLQMPGMNGFEVIRRLDASPLPIIVVVTAYDEYAVQAFEAGAIDYLLKPVSQERLQRAVERAMRLSGRPREIAENLAQLQSIADAQAPIRPKKIVGRAGEEYFLLNPDDVLAFQADGDLVWIITLKRKYLATVTLKALQQKLQNNTFQRVHRNALVNVNHVRKMSALSSQRWLLTLDNNQEFIVSKRQAKTVREILSW